MRRVTVQKNVRVLAPHPRLGSSSEEAEADFSWACLPRAVRLRKPKTDSENMIRRPQKAFVFDLQAETENSMEQRRKVDSMPNNELGKRITTPLGLFLILLLSAVLSPAQDQGWPRQMTKPGGTIILYQPQVDDWKNYQQVDARMAFSVTPTGGKSHVGIVTVQLESATNMDDHTVFLSHPQITSVTFPSLDPATATQMEQLVRTFLNPAATMTISLDRLVASVKKTKAPPLAGVKNDPPTIFISMRPAILLLVNGAPVMAPIANSNLQFIVNANWPVFTEQGGSTYYLFDGKGWLLCNSLQGTWTPTNQLPKQMSKVLANPNFADLKSFIPAPPGSAATFPMVYYSATPAEIVVFSGRPQWTPIPGTQLSYASNTESTVLKYTPTEAFYYLTSGRWFTTTTPLMGRGHSPPTHCRRILRGSLPPILPEKYWPPCRERPKPKMQY